VLAGAACITVVADRESDIYEQFARRPAGVQLLARAAQDRSLAEVGRLFATIDAWPEQHRETIVLACPTERALRVIRLHGGRLQCSEHLLNGPHCPCCGGDGVVSSQHAQQRRHFDDAFGRYHAEFRRMATQGMRITIS
jgi:hypothetical protein